MVRRAVQGRTEIPATPVGDVGWGRPAPPPQAGLSGPGATGRPRHPGQRVAAVLVVDRGVRLRAAGVRPAGGWGEGGRWPRRSGLGLAFLSHTPSLQWLCQGQKKCVRTNGTGPMDGTSNRCSEENREAFRYFRI